MKTSITAIVLLFSITCSISAPLQTANAQTYATEAEHRAALLLQIQQLMQLLNTLLAQARAREAADPSEPTLESINLYNGTSVAQQTDPDIDGKTKIKITDPRNGTKFPWTGDVEPLEIQWEAENVPKNSVVGWETEIIQLYSGNNGGGGGSYEIPSGDSYGTRTVTYGPSYQSPGEYRVRMYIRECHSQGCTKNPDFPGQEEDVEVYAVSGWREYTIGSRDAEVYETTGDITIEDLSPEGTIEYFGESVEISFTLEGIPTGDILACVFMESRNGGMYNALGDACQPAVNGTNEFDWIPGTGMASDQYRIEVHIQAEDDGSGKDRGRLAERRGDWFSLRGRQ